MDIFSSSSTFKLAKNFLPKLLKSLIDLRGNRRSEIDKVSDISGEAVELVRYYIEPNCQQFNPADYDDETRHIVREPLFSRLQHFFSGPIITGGNQLFILADSGMGKTSALVMLKLAHINSFWPKGYDCSLLKLGNDSIDLINKISSKRNTILFLDALDEDPNLWGKTKERIAEILNATKNFKRVVITCRTQFFSGGEDPFNRRGQIEVGGYLCPVLYLSLFDDDQIDRYCHKRFPLNREMASKVRAILSKMKSLRCRPMLLAHIEDIINSDIKNWTDYDVYNALITAWLQREHRKLSELKKKFPSVDELKFACRLYATCLYTKDIKSMGAIRFNQLLTFNDKLKHIETMDIGGRSLLNKNSKGEFRFSHYSVQEFMVIEAVINNEVDVNIKPTYQMLDFLFSYLDKLLLDERWFVPLRHLVLSGLSLKNRNISYVRIQGGSLVESDLSNANLESSNFENSNFMNSNMQGVNLEGANLRWANLKGVDLTNANLTGAKLDHANLEGAIIEKALLINADLSNTNLKKASLAYSNIGGASFNGAIVENTNFRNCIPRED